MTISRILLLAALMTACLSAHASASGGSPRLAVIIDDVGYRVDQDLAVMNLDRRVAVAVIPNAPHAGQMARRAAAQNREILVHLPLPHRHPTDCEAPVCPRREWSAERMRQHLAWAFGEVEGAIGINNHQGSLFTADAAATRRLVEGLVLFNRDREQPLFVIDSRTSPGSVLAEMAAEAGLSVGQRRVFLDHDRRPAAMDRAWEDSLRLARRDGGAILIAHPHPESVSFLATAVATLEQEGIELVPASTLVRSGTVRRPGTGYAAAAIAYPGSIDPSRP